MSATISEADSLCQATLRSSTPSLITIPRCVPSRAVSMSTHEFLTSHTNRRPCSSAVIPSASISRCIPGSFPDTFHFSSPLDRSCAKTSSLVSTSRSPNVHMSFTLYFPSYAMGISWCVGGVVLQSTQCILPVSLSQYSSCDGDDVTVHMARDQWGLTPSLCTT